MITGFFDNEDSDLSRQFQKTASALSDDLRFAHTTSEEILKKFGYKKYV